MHLISICGKKIFASFAVKNGGSSGNAACYLIKPGGFRAENALIGGGAVMTIDSQSSKRYSVVDDGRVFTVALLSSLTWTFLRYDHSASSGGLLGTLAVSITLIYLFGTPLARLAYILAGKRPLAARLVFGVVALTVVGLMAHSQ